MDYYFDVLKKYAVFEGRARRREYWMFVLFNAMAALIVGFISGIIGTKLLLDLYYLAVLIPRIAVSIRRLHDTGRSGWWLLLALVPVVGTIVIIVFQATDGQPGVNKYGPNPKGIS